MAAPQVFKLTFPGFLAWVPSLVIAAPLFLVLGLWVHSYAFVAFAVFYLLSGWWLKKLVRRGGTRPSGGTVEVGTDGIRVRGRFIPWSAIRAVQADVHRATVVSDQGTVAMRMQDASAFAQFANKQRLEYEELGTLEVLELALREGESEQQRVDRVADAARRGAAYREGVLNPEKLRDLSIDPTSSADERLVAARVLVRVAPDLVPPVRAALGAMVDTEFRERMKEVLDE